MLYSMTELNQMDREAFVEALGAVFEETPKIALQTWKQRPFANVMELHQQMADVVNAMDLDEQIALIRAHPDLGSKARMAEDSVREQVGVGLDKEKFGFPFIIAVKNHTKETILEAFERRLENSADCELAQALVEVFEIARLRLNERITEL
jgi:2-oxo-4-hydroxy-4-carboxy-5-ureidoimidazoline decarboxylase